MMNVYTGMAVDAYRAEEAATRRLKIAAGKREETARLVPEDERGLYFLATEIVRLEADARECRDYHDFESYDWCMHRVVELRSQLAHDEHMHQCKKSNRCGHEGCMAYYDEQVATETGPDGVRNTGWCWDPEEHESDAVPEHGHYMDRVQIVTP
jgi:hypothetical protein